MLVRLLTFPVSDEEDGLTLRSVCRRRGCSRQDTIELKKKPGLLLLDGEPARFNDRARAGSVLTLKILEEKESPVIPVRLPFGIVYEDEDLIVVDKPAGMPTHPSGKNTANSLASALCAYYQEKDRPFVFRCSNRLDQDTSGLTVVAKHYLSAGILSEMGQRREIHREYAAIIRGRIDPPCGTIDIPLGRLTGSRIERTQDPFGERAVTHYETEIAGETFSLLRLTLETGRTHQIRIHLKSIGHPLIGDYLYNPDMEVIGRQALHARRLSFAHPITGEKLSFESSLPSDMASIVEAMLSKGPYGDQGEG